MSAYIDYEWREEVQAALKLLGRAPAVNLEMERWRFEVAAKAATDILKTRAKAVVLADEWNAGCQTPGAGIDDNIGL